MPDTENKPQNQLKQDFHIIEEELNADKKQVGRPRNLTFEMLNDFLYWLYLTGEYKWAAIRCKMGLSAFERYQAKSDHFRALAEAARNDGVIRARMNIISSIRGQEEVKDPETGIVTSKAVPPSIEDSKWLLLYEDRIGNNKMKDEDGKPVLGVPKTEKEAELMVMILNRHADHVDAKRKQNSDS